MWHVQTLNMIAAGSPRRRCDRPVIGGDLTDAYVVAWLSRDRYGCTVSQHRDPLSLEKGQRPHALAT